MKHGERPNPTESYLRKLISDSKWLMECLPSYSPVKVENSKLVISFSKAPCTNIRGHVLDSRFISKEILAKNNAGNTTCYETIDQAFIIKKRTIKSFFYLYIPTVR